MSERVTFQHIKNQNGNWVRLVEFDVIEVTETEMVDESNEDKGYYQTIWGRDCDGHIELMNYYFTWVESEITQEPHFTMTFQVRHRNDWFQATPMEPPLAEEIVDKCTKGDNVDDILEKK